MKLYRRQLSSVDELKREKIRLRYERMHTKSSDLNPIAELGGKKKKGGDVAASNFMGLAMQMLSAKSGGDRLMKVVPFLMKRLNKRPKDKEGKQGKSILAMVAGEVLTGYLVGKGVLVGAHLLTGYIKKRKAKAVEKKMMKKLQRRVGIHAA